MILRVPIKHCKNCGTAVVYRIPDDGDTKERAARNKSDFGRGVLFFDNAGDGSSGIA